MNVMTQDMDNKIMIEENIFPRWEHNIPTLGTKHSHAGNKTTLRLAVTLLLMMVVGVSGVKADDYSGTYYIRSEGKNASADNKYYLCPTEGWYFYNATNSYVEPDNGKPFLTTFKCKDNSSYDTSKAVWTLVKHQTEENCYYIIQKKTGRYMISNGQISGSSSARRMRVHLETVANEDALSALGDLALFEITSYPSDNTVKTSHLRIVPHSSEGRNGTTEFYLVVNNGNYDALTAQTLQTGGKNDGPNGSFGKATDGIIGVYSYEQNAGWNLEDYITRPTIRYSGSDGIEITNNVTDATVYYTTDGTDPKNSETSFTGTSTVLPSFTDGTVIKAVSKIGEEYSNVATFTAYVHVGNSNPYVIQTVDGGSFYLVPPITTETYVTTTNIPHEKMAWYFMDAGQSNGVQYHYIVNNSTNEYLYCSGGKSAANAFVMKAPNADDTESTRYRFMFVPSGEGLCVIPEKFATETKGMCMSKKNGNNATDYLNLSNGTDNYSRWMFIARPDNPKTLFDNSFASSSTDSKYYKIQNANSTHNIIPPTTAGGNATTKDNATGDNTMWYFVPTADGDSWVEYYNIRNGLTGEYLYFNGTAGDNNTVFTSSSIITGNENQYKFIVVKGASSDYPDAYNIIPKALKDQVNQANNSLNRNGTTLRTQNSRNTPASLWNLVDGEYTVAPPYITYDVATNTATISCTYPGATIYYTTDGTEVTVSSTHTIPTDPNPFELAAGVTTIRAIASKDVVGTSAESTYNNIVQVTKSSAEADLRPYIIQSKQCQSYNLIPNVSIDENTKYVSTLNVPCETMAWHFEYAEEGYYYVVDKNGWYLYYTETDNSSKYVYLKNSKDDSDGYKFSITAHANGGFNLIPKGQTTPVNKANYGGGGVGLTPAKLAGNIGDANSRWSIIPYRSDNLPMWVTAPFDNVSDNEHTFYYKIVSVDKTTRPIILNDNGEVKSQEIPNGIDERKTMWVIKKVADDGNDLLDFYTFQNAYTGEKLYYNGNGRNKTTNSYQLGLPSVNGANDQWSHFVVVQTETGKGYNIIPRPIIDNTKAINTSSDNEGFNCINRANGSDVLGTYYDDGNGSRWTFSQVTDPVQCLEPVITLDNDNARFSMSCPTNAAKIYYTLDGTTPVIPASGTTQEYTVGSNVALTSDVVKIIAVAAIAADGSDKSSAVSVEKVVLPTITINSDNSVTLASTTDGATIYYKLGGDNPTTANGIQSSSIASILPSQGPIKVLATKDGLINSNIATESNIPAKTIAVNSTNATLTSTDPIVYNGTAHQPAFTVKDGETTIGSGEYTATYSDNTNAGTATITITDNADGDYNVSGSFTFTIEQKALTITAKAKEITYGDEPANDGVTYGGFIEGESESTEGMFTGTLTYDYSYSQNGDVGSYAITPSGLTATNYAITYNTGVLTVSQKEVGLSWSETPLVYDGSAQTPTATATGTVNNDEIVVTVSGAETNAGTDYTATASGLTGTKAGNYKLPSEGLTHTFTIAKANISPTVSIAGWTYGDVASTPSVEGNTESGTITYTYKASGDDTYTETVPTNAGDYTIKASIATTTNYLEGEATADFTISPKSIGDGNRTATGITIQMTSAGELETVKDGEITLVEDTDYTHSIEETGADKIVTVTGIGNYTDSAKGIYANPVFTDPDGDNPEQAAAVYKATRDMASPSGIKPYIVRKVNPTIGTLTISEIDYIPEDVPVLLLSDEEADGFVASPKDENIAEITAQTKNSNLLKVAPTGGVEVESAQVYSFYKGEFVLTKKGTLSEGKFYIYNPNYTATPAEEEEQQQGGGNAPSLSTLRFVIEEDPTGIVEMSNEKGETRNGSAWYTLDGRKLNGQPTKAGLYIKNGRKTVIKRK